MCAGMVQIVSGWNISVACLPECLISPVKVHSGCKFDSYAFAVLLVGGEFQL